MPSAAHLVAGTHKSTLATVFGLAVTAGGGGRMVPGRPYREYRMRDYSPWLRSHVSADRYWRPALACVASSRACPKVAGWTPDDYMRRDLTPVQSGCCKPPTSCVYGGDGLTGQGPAVVAVQDEDCFRWQNDPAVLCYGCDSCRAGVLEQLRRHWHNVTVVNAVLLLLLIAVCSCGCCAFRNAVCSYVRQPEARADDGDGGEVGIFSAGETKGNKGQR